MIKGRTVLSVGRLWTIFSNQRLQLFIVKFKDFHLGVLAFFKSIPFLVKQFFCEKFSVQYDGFLVGINFLLDAIQVLVNSASIIRITLYLTCLWRPFWWFYIALSAYLKTFTIDRYTQVNREEFITLIFRFFSKKQNTHSCFHYSPIWR